VKQNSIVAIVDAGNTRVKIGVFENEELRSSHSFSKYQEKDFKSFLNSEDFFVIFVSSVLSEEENQLWFDTTKVEFLKSNAELPIKIKYSTPETLGQDRLINVVAAWNENPNQNSLVIDIGTCLKFDLVNDKGEYLGGSISPGMQLRFKSLNDYTGKLPLVNSQENPSLIGDSTQNSILSGVQNGIKSEINDLIRRYTTDFEDLTVFVTGGDVKYFDFPQKSNIFALENLTLKGLFYIYKLNA
jgi:type III pantothenate kinase